MTRTTTISPAAPALNCQPFVTCPRVSKVNVGADVFADDQVLATCTSTIKPSQLKRMTACLQTACLKSSFFICCDCTCLVRMRRLDCCTTDSSAACAKKTRNVWTRAMTRARNGVATSANSTAVAPRLSTMRATHRLRRFFPGAICISVMVLISVREAGSTRRDLDEQVRQRGRDVAAGLNVGEQAGRGAGLQLLCDLTR